MFPAVGDAALAFDPLSSQGMMTGMELAFLVGKVLAEKLGGCTYPGPPTSVPEVFENVRLEYERKKRYYYDVETRFRNEEFWRYRPQPDVP
jgi:flavin-dependent dehydrogenase